jgi:histidinol-phosphate phosphatase family protein
MSLGPTSWSVDVVVPTVGRRSLVELLDALAAMTELTVGRILLVDDRADRSSPLLPHDPPPAIAGRVEIIAGEARGPAAARNRGWRASQADWIAFLDDDVVPTPTWAADLVDDLAACDDSVGGTQGRITVPLPADRRPTDWERNVAGLETAQWATADLAYRRSVLDAVGGFDERFPRAYREDADLGLRVVGAGKHLTTGRRTVTHPVRPAPWHVSVGKQRGNTDDALMDRLHGPGWRERAGAPAGRRRRHLTVTGAGAAAVGALALRRPTAVVLFGLAWTAGTAELAARRIAPGPRTPAEVAAMVATSAVLPAAATVAWARGLVRARRLAPSPGVDRADVALPSEGRAGRSSVEPAAHDREAPGVDVVLLDRDGTIVVDVPYNGDPDRVVPVPGAREALDRLRAAGVRLALVSNQSGIARGLLTPDQVDAVNARVDELLGPFEAVLVCPHGPDDGCPCRKPLPGMVSRAAELLGVPTGRCGLIGDIGSDVDAALAAGARPVLVPTAITRPDEVAAAPEVAPDLGAAVDLLLAARVSP